jgi:hypothetical protein
MTLFIFLGVVVSLLILRLVPGLLLRLVLAIPRHQFIALMRRLHRRKLDVLTRRNAPPVGIRRRARLVLVSSSLLMLALLATTAYWSTHASSLMMLLR